MAKLLRQHLPRLLEAEGGDSKPDLDVYFHVNVMNFIELIRCVAETATIHACLNATGEMHQSLIDRWCPGLLTSHGALLHLIKLPALRALRQACFRHAMAWKLWRQRRGAPAAIRDTEPGWLLQG